MYFSYWYIALLHIWTFHIPLGLGLRSVALTTVGGVMVGACAQFLYDQFEVWRRRKAIQIHYPQLTREDDWQEEEKEQWSWVGGVADIYTDLVNHYSAASPI